MAGSWDHVVDERGALIDNEQFRNMIETLGDAYEMAEEMYGMVYYLASRLHNATGADIASLIEDARTSYKEGLLFSPSNRDTP